MSDGFPYKVKFTDIRVKPPGRGGRGRGRASATEEVKTCEHNGCDQPGDCKSPRHGGGFHNFCQRHAAEYNKNWNFFDGMTEAEVKAFNEKARHGHKETWKFGTGPVSGKKAGNMYDPRKWRGREIFDLGEEGAAPSARRQKGRTRLEIRALNELDLEDTASAADIRARYADYVRRFHPDSNDGDRSSEDKLARVIRAWKTLKAAGLTKD